MTTTTDWMPLARQLADTLTTKGAIVSETVAHAIASVPRHLFITGHYATGAHRTVDPAQPTDELLHLAYADRGIMTHIPTDAAEGWSSTSQPSIVAKMLEAAALTPGMRVLEVGAGTGWNAALIAYITGAEVTTIETSPVVADEARAALGRADVQGVTVVTADGYLGHDAAGPYDLILVTCGVSGIPAAWLGQLADGGSVLAPLAHGGLHPLTRIRPTAAGLTGRLVTNADFMAATGPLYAATTPAPIARDAALPAPDPAATRRGTVPAGLDPRGDYVDLWMHLAARDPRTTCASAEGTSDYTGCALVADDDTAVFVQPGALHPTPSPAAQALADEAGQLIAEWTESGRPALTAWSCSFAPAGQPTHPVLAPAAWSL
ncbi:protein-L-isoaspartate O-methyltransferase [Streptomyces sp. B1866]|uniref:protein-L-isoaspartate O-methyltransferase family protein n=1 Tax=Streptomyces sp. B1866 TaxID=3075431 RepID=UPI0028928465|nr:protein-L-isoaspartate O-methyltransferase [Streptomyces sp. B1866]MDT3397425.1 protein-L-isoaspartate O-methyltransferase [Streptomyces sp. B1866]